MRSRGSRGVSPAALPRDAYAEVADAVAADIRAGRLPPGAPLPEEPALAEAYGVEPRTAREAVRELSERGLVDTPRPDQGPPRVASPPSSPPPDGEEG
ncbi:GntR family transcriptional regulator [Streptomyces sp. DSM 44917]|uniref:GntR family transcriptional regulator n=1 Tax=Streptomyces boetiae TaxID=3075541 RepID=A0ABU2L5J2_9ACTN|nr:GntR family transcriptional regulator [Streptomyces sp. DSM 44917]MDT0306826.1 GntR family transcriptional regulator [Streptomyces sp. DSM 44917]